MSDAAPKILVVGGTRLFSEQIRQLLAEQGYSMQTATALAEGMALCMEWGPHLVICGDELQDAGGAHFLMALRDDSRFHHIPLIFISSRDGRESMRMVMNLGADDYLVMPFKKQDLLLSIRSRLTRFAAFRQLRLAIEEKQDITISVPVVPAELQEKLSKTESRIIRLIAEGKSTGEIAGELYISAKTVENHKYNIARKLGLSGRNSLTEYVIKNIIRPL